MKRIDIKSTELNLNPHQTWLNQWFLLMAGNFSLNDFNTMTVAWGSIGTMWNKPFVQVVVRPTRYTYQFTEKYNTFSLCAFPENCRNALKILGTKSGKDGDKISESGLTPAPAKKIEAPVFEEAELIIECKKIYWDDFKPEHFLKEEIANSYPQFDYHRIYFGEIIHITGIEKFKLIPSK